MGISSDIMYENLFKSLFVKVFIPVGLQNVFSNKSDLKTLVQLVECTFIVIIESIKK